MSVLVRYLNDGENRLFVKGSPEKIKELCNLNSLPKEYDEILQQYTENGYRVISMA